MIFPKWTNKLPIFLAMGSVVFLVGAVFIFWFWFSPKHTDIGYAPKQPIPYSHALHVGELGLDCRYCHFNVEKSSHAGIPPTSVCMNCHSAVKTESPYIQKIKESFEKNEPIEWVKVHNLPDYAYFDHSVHLSAGVSCVSCHGRVDKMEIVYQSEPLSMSWCLDCHKAPEKHLRPKEFLTKLDWVPEEDPAVLGAKLKAHRNINPKQDCSTCHR